MKFEATKVAALNKLNNFVEKNLSEYSKLRNFDFGPEKRTNISGLSPYVTHGIINEKEIIKRSLSKFSFSKIEKFIQEVFWRTYWKGWLEMRPTVWAEYSSNLNKLYDQLQTQSGLRKSWEEACTGNTGIDCFDSWAKELFETGYLHNHSRMWFASIWIHTLELPWELGADFFLRTLLDADPASNTLSWRWVGGAQTVGKTYMASAQNIQKFTKGRFSP